MTSTNDTTITALMTPEQLIQHAATWSLYLRQRLNAQPQLATQLTQDCRSTLLAGTIQLWLDELLAQQQLPSRAVLLSKDIRHVITQPEQVAQWTIDDCKRVLRRLRQRVLTTLLVRDLGQLASLEEVVGAMTMLADLAVQLAYRTVMMQLCQRHGIPTDPQTGQPLELLMVAMGKLGGQELNVSSDIDLISLYPEEGTTLGSEGLSLSHHEFFTKVVQLLVNILSEQTPDGFVFRTDLRLRPDGAGSPIAWSIDALSQYLIQHGREWERYAWIKARLIPLSAFSETDQQRHNQRFLQIQRSFVYRQYFDFDSLAALRQLREQIRYELSHHYQRKRTPIDSQRHIKLGDGGIREMEFIVQVIQLVRGGLMPSLRHRNFLHALEAEAHAGILQEHEAQQLRNAYYFLRRLEHVLQYKNDSQTHLLPTSEEELGALASAMGLSKSVFLTRLNTHRQHVTALFKQVLRVLGVAQQDNADVTQQDTANTARETRHAIAPTPEATQLVPEDGLNSTKATNTLKNVATHINNLKQSYRIKSLNESGKKRIDALLPHVIAAAQQTDDPEVTLIRLFDLIESLAQRSNYMALFSEFPHILKRIARLLAASPWVANYLMSNPIVLDQLITWNELLEPVNIPARLDQLRLDLDASVLEDGSPDVELRMNLMRDLKRQVTFQLLAQDLEGSLRVEHLADELSLLADGLLQLSMEQVWPLLGQDNQPAFAIIGYGRLGGKELGYESDLDLVFLFDDPSASAVEIYSRFARRLNHWLTTLTSSGRLYETDTRLRPDGEAGLLAVSIDGFEQYQQYTAWLWEHQALTRARYCAGDPGIGMRFERLREDILKQPRELSTLQQGIVDMREKMHQAHPNSSDAFDIKHDRGGMVDIEFITQYLVLAHSHQHLDLLGNWGNINLLQMAAEADLIPHDLGHRVAGAYRDFRSLQHRIRLQGHERARIDAERLLPQRQAVQQLWTYIFNPS